MAKVCKDFDSWLVQNISSRKDAAYFLLAALEDSIEHKHMEHFFSATHKVARVHKVKPAEAIGFLFEHVEEKDLRDAYRNISHVVGALMATVEKAHLIPA